MSTSLRVATVAYWLAAIIALFVWRDDLGEPFPRLLLPLVILGLLIGFVSSRQRALALIGTVVVAPGYIGVVVFELSWASQCWDCAVLHDPVLRHLGVDEFERREFAWWTAVIFGLVGWSVGVSIWAGLGTVLLLRRALELLPRTQ